jgi:hypothetical protein
MEMRAEHDSYVEAMRPSKARCERAPDWLTRLAQHVPDGEGFWQ